ncbi:MAG: ABC transporter substrate-binding protein [Defluviitaleaceae bacterium]|nr:ABC transporter substrate-binding protein [Defluviitaleaceae bacterium]
MKKFLVSVLILILIVTAGIMAINIRYPVRHMDVIREHAGELEPSLILAVIMAESSFREGAQSHVGAQGLMQIMPATAEDIARQMGLDFQPDDVWVPEINIAMGSFYLNRLVRQFGCVDVALAAYNAGQGNVNNWLGNPEFSGDGQNLDVIPFRETANYVRRVRQAQRMYEIILRVRGWGVDPPALGAAEAEAISPPRGVDEDAELIELQEPTAVSAIAADGVLRLHMRPPATLNPLVNEDVTVARILRMLFEPLAILDNEFRVTGNLAELEFASDFRSVNATIRQGAVWSDGLPVTSDDVIFSMEFLNDENIVDAVRIDARTVQIVFERASVMSGYSLTFPVIPRHYFESAQSTPPPTSGVFAFESQTMHGINLRRAHNFGNIEAAEIIFLPNVETDFTAFERGRIDALHMPLPEWTRRRGVRSPNYQTVPAMYFEFIGFNFRRNILRDVNTRRGIAHAFNADEAVAAVYLSYAARSATPIHPYHWAAGDARPVYDPARAAALLGTVRTAEPIAILANAENPQRAAIAERLAESLTVAGLAANAKIVDSDEYFARIDAHDFDLFIGGIELPFSPDVQFFFTPGEFFLYDTTLAAAFGALTLASTEAAYEQAMNRLQEAFSEQLPVIGLAFKHSALLTSPRISGDLNPTPDHVFSGVDAWGVE